MMPTASRLAIDPRRDWNRIRAAVRKVDAVTQVSHLDRDEFAVLIEELHAIEDVRRVALRLLE